MTRLTLFLLLALSLWGCDSRKREAALQQRETALNEKEQQLILKEKTLELKEAELQNKERLLDSSSSQNTSRTIDSTLLGQWSVKMTCTETTCTGSAVGDVKTETWNITHESNTIIAKAMSNNQLVRVYSGAYNGKSLELSEDKMSSDTATSTRMAIRLSVVDNAHLEGQREIIRNNCRVVYALQLEKERTNK